MRHVFVATALLALTALSSESWAGPYIIATNVAAKCAGRDATLTTVSVTLNNTTHSFYGTQLFYHFTPNPNGLAATLSTPVSNPNPVPLFLQPGKYNLQITNQATPGGSSSPTYSVTVPNNMVQVLFGGRKICNTVHLPGSDAAVPLKDHQ